MAEYRANFFFMVSTAERRDSSKEGAYLMISSTSRSTCSRRSADLRARSVFQGLSSSFANAMFTSDTTPSFDVGTFQRGNLVQSSPAVQAQHLAGAVGGRGEQEENRLHRFVVGAEASGGNAFAHGVARPRRLQDPD